MELSPKQQTVELLKTSQKILIATHENPDGDAIGSVLALALGLKKIGKEVTALLSGVVPAAFGFLPGRDILVNNLSQSRDFIIVLDTSENKVEKLSYRTDSQKQKLSIVVTPAAGSFNPGQVSFSESQANFEAIIILDCPDIERLGRLYDDNTKLFYETPLVNIDHHAGNDYFGKVNWVDLTATSTAEILVSLLESLGREESLLDADIATALLTGIITDTGSFQNANTTPKSFTVAAQLVAAGARQQEIIRAVYKTKPFSTLKLWGKILASIQLDQTDRFVWSRVTAEEIRESGASETEISGVIDELLKSATGADFAFLLSERDSAVHGSLRAIEKGVSVLEIAGLFGGGGHQEAAAFQIPDTTLLESQEQILEKVRGYQKTRSGGLPANATP